MVSIPTIGSSNGFLYLPGKVHIPIKILSQAFLKIFLSIIAAVIKMFRSSEISTGADSMYNELKLIQKHYGPTSARSAFLPGAPGDR